MVAKIVRARLWHVWFQAFSRTSAADPTGNRSTGSVDRWTASIAPVVNTKEVFGAHLECVVPYGSARRGAVVICN